MSTGPALRLDGVGKRYDQLVDSRMLLRSIMPFARKQHSELWALRGVDLELDPGETVGILGRNGSGKSTMLRVLAGVTEPTEGSVEVRGRLAPLLSVGVGFHPEMTGRENILVNGLLLGLDRSEIDARYADIVAFAELGDFIDTPVKFYSSGMFMRLGFSVAIHTEPQILLVDEILAVGDVAFQRKCFDRMRKLQEDGLTIVFVSHFMAAIRLLCPRAIVLRKGTVEFDGDVEDAIGLHHRFLGGRSDDRAVPHTERVPRGTVVVDDERLEIAGRGSVTSALAQEDDVRYRATLRFGAEVEAVQLMFSVRAADGSIVYQAISRFGDGDHRHGDGDEAGVEVAFSPAIGGGGTFTAEVVVTDRTGGDVLGRTEDPVPFYVSPRLGVFGYADLGAEILVDGVVVNDHQSMTFDAKGTPRP